MFHVADKMIVNPIEPEKTLNSKKYRSSVAICTYFHDLVM
jgi:hypothetical protein